MDEEGLQKTANDLIYIGQKIDFDVDEFHAQLESLRDLTEGQESLLRSRIQTLVPTYVQPSQKVSV
jgi:hypothetical protein